MPIKKSAIKHLRQTKKKTVRNSKVKSELKEFIKQARKAVSVSPAMLAGKDKTKLQELRQKLQKVIDKAAQKGVIKKNNAARRKSRLMRQINAILKKI